MEEIDIRICLKKIKSIQKRIYQENQPKYFFFFSLHDIKMEQKAFIFDQQCKNSIKKQLILTK